MRWHLGTTMAILALLLIATGGCWRFNVDSSGWDYVYDIGGPEEITEWALEQQEMERIADARLALTKYLESEVEDEARAAVDGLVRIHNKLVHGWPSLDDSEGDLHREIEHAITSTYYWLAQEAHRLPSAREAFVGVRPQEHKPARMKEWRESGEHFGLF